MSQPQPIHCWASQRRETITVPINIIHIDLYFLHTYKYIRCVYLYVTWTNLAIHLLLITRVAIIHACIYIYILTKQLLVIYTFIYVCIYIYTPRIQSMDYLRSDHDFCMHFRQLIFRLISDKFRQSMGNSRWLCHGLSRSVTAFSDNAQDLSIVFCLLSRFVTVCHGLSRNMLGNLKPIWTFLR